MGVVTFLSSTSRKTLMVGQLMGMSFLLVMLFLAQQKVNVLKDTIDSSKTSAETQFDQINLCLDSFYAYDTTSIKLILDNLKDKYTKAVSVLLIIMFSVAGLPLLIFLLLAIYIACIEDNETEVDIKQQLKTNSKEMLELYKILN